MASMNTCYANLNEVLFTMALEDYDELKRICDSMPIQPDASVQGKLQEITVLFNKRGQDRIDFDSMNEVVNIDNPDSDIYKIKTNLDDYYIEFRTKFQQAVKMAEIFKNKLNGQNKKIEQSYFTNNPTRLKNAVLNALVQCTQQLDIVTITQKPDGEAVLALNTTRYTEEFVVQTWEKTQYLARLAFMMNKSVVLDLNDTETNYVIERKPNPADAGVLISDSNEYCSFIGVSLKASNSDSAPTIINWGRLGMNTPIPFCCINNTKTPFYHTALHKIFPYETFVEKMKDHLESQYPTTQDYDWKNIYNLLIDPEVAAAVATDAVAADAADAATAAHRAHAVAVPSAVAAAAYAVGGAAAAAADGVPWYSTVPWYQKLAMDIACIYTKKIPFCTDDDPSTYDSFFTNPDDTSQVSPENLDLQLKLIDTKYIIDNINLVEVLKKALISNRVISEDEWYNILQSIGTNEPNDSKILKKRLGVQVNVLDYMKAPPCKGTVSTGDFNIYRTDHSDKWAIYGDQTYFYKLERSSTISDIINAFQKKRPMIIDSIRAEVVSQISDRSQGLLNIFNASVGRAVEGEDGQLYNPYSNYLKNLLIRIFHLQSNNMEYCLLSCNIIKKKQTKRQITSMINFDFLKQLLNDPNYMCVQKNQPKRSGTNTIVLTIDIVLKTDNDIYFPIILNMRIKASSVLTTPTLKINGDLHKNTYALLKEVSKLYTNNHEAVLRENTEIGRAHV